jgi:signal transduction histidine kinase
LATGVRWTGILMVVSLIAGNGQRLMVDAMKQQEEVNVRMRELQEANTLLFDLQRIARRLPASLDLPEVLRTTVQEFAAATGLSRVSVLLLEEGQRWTVAEARGASMPIDIHVSALPTAARSAIATRSTVRADPGSVALMGTPGLTLAAGIYSALIAREQMIGLLVGEEAELDTVGEQSNRDLLSITRQLNGPAAIAIDNARWFGRIRVSAADDERVRIARDLHDRIGQSLAVIGFEVDRIGRHADSDNMRLMLDGLREQVRSAVTDVRETLYDLRTDVTESQSLVTVIADFLERVELRSDLTTVLDVQASAPLPVRTGRELWHMTQEAIVNAERHAHCKHLTVTVSITPTLAAIDVADDGIGFSASSGRPDSYGLRGLRERAAALGAKFDQHRGVAPP